MAAYQWRQRWDALPEHKYFRWGDLDYRTEVFRTARRRHKRSRIHAQHLQKLRAWSLFFVLLFCTVALLYYVYLVRLMYRFEHEGGWAEPQRANARPTEHQVIQPHARWVDDADRWRQVYPGELYVFSAFYYYQETFLPLPEVLPERPQREAPPIVVLGLMASCSYHFEARVVYQDYPHSLRLPDGRCRRLEANGTYPLKAVALEFKSGQPADRVPVSISLIINDKDSQVWFPVRSTVLPITSVQPHGTVGVCSRIDQQPNVPLLAEFLAFHRLLGVSWFTMYTAGDLPSGLAGAAVVLPWNTLLKSASSAYAVFVQDCIYRSRPHVEHVLILDPDEFFVPRRDHDIQSVIRVLPEADVYKTNTVSFCGSNSSMKTKHVLETQTKIRRSNDSSWKPMLFRCRGDGRKEMSVPPNVSLVHRYRDSQECITAGHTDDTARRFAERLLVSREVRHFLLPED